MAAHTYDDFSVLGVVPALLRTLVKSADVGLHWASKTYVQPALVRVIRHLKWSEVPLEAAAEWASPILVLGIFTFVSIAIAVFWIGLLRNKRKSSNRGEPSLVHRFIDIDAGLRALGRRPPATQPMPPPRGRLGTAGSTGTPLGVSSSMRTLRRSGGGGNGGAQAPTSSIARELSAMTMNGQRPRLNTAGTAPSQSDSRAGETAALFSQHRTRTRTESYNNYLEEDDEEYYEFTPPNYWDDEAGEGGSSADEGVWYEYYYGPYRACLTYESWTPPPTWNEASKTVLPFHHRLPLQRVIALRVASECTIQILPPGACAPSGGDGDKGAKPVTVPAAATRMYEPALELPVEEVATHIQHAEGGVLQLYVKESSREEWMEHTFATASHCAQFQTDLLALQLLGPAVYDMYQALEILHQGSMACPASELVLHDSAMDFHETGDPAKRDAKKAGQSKGIAWDDVMRCLGSSFPSIRYRLEALWWKQALPTSPRRRKRSDRRSTNQGERRTSTDPMKPPVTAGEKDRGADLSHLLTDDYVKKRLLLGPIDFFRLFAPTVEGTALPKVGVEPLRVEQLLRWRKRVARASVMVQAYVEARVVVNKGWKLNKPVPDDYWTRRLAFDENIDNVRWDASKENEYYEGTVSRDVMVRVRGLEYLYRQARWRLGFGHQVSHLSPVQGYSLVGIHTFRFRDGKQTSRSETFPIQPGVDPVEALPSLRQLIESHPNLHFFVSCLYPEFLNVSICHVAVFVRSLPRGVDRSFDANVSSDD
jgi:hypothetical protein